MYSYNPYKWPCKWTTGVVTPLNGVLTLLKTPSFAKRESAHKKEIREPFLVHAHGGFLNHYSSIRFVDCIKSVLKKKKSQDDQPKSGDEDHLSTLLYNIIYIISIKKQDVVSKATWLRRVAIHPKLVHRLDQRRMSGFHDP